MLRWRWRWQYPQRSFSPTLARSLSRTGCGFIYLIHKQSFDLFTVFIHFVVDWKHIFTTPNTSHPYPSLRSEAPIRTGENRTKSKNVGETRSSNKSNKKITNLTIALSEKKRTWIRTLIKKKVCNMLSSNVLLHILPSSTLYRLITECSCGHRISYWDGGGGGSEQEWEWAQAHSHAVISVVKVNQSKRKTFKSY